MTDVPDDPAADCRQRAGETKRRKSREALVNAALALTQNGEPLFLGALCLSAGVSQATFRTHFGGMSTFCVDVFVLKMEASLDEITREGGVTPRQFLDALRTEFAWLAKSVDVLDVETIAERVEQLITVYRVPLPNASPLLASASELALLMLSLVGNWIGEVDPDVASALLARQYSTREGARD